MRHATPPVPRICSVTLWGMPWFFTLRLELPACIDLVNINGQWLDARSTIRDTLCDALLRELAAQEAEEVAV